MGSYNVENKIVKHYAFPQFQAKSNAPLVEENHLRVLYLKTLGESN